MVIDGPVVSSYAEYIPAPTLAPNHASTFASLSLLSRRRSLSLSRLLLSSLPLSLGGTGGPRRGGAVARRGSVAAQASWAVGSHVEVARRRCEQARWPPVARLDEGRTSRPPPGTVAASRTDSGASMTGFVVLSSDLCRAPSMKPSEAKGGGGMVDDRGPAMALATTSCVSAPGAPPPSARGHVFLRPFRLPHS